MTKEKEIVQSGAVALLKGREMIYNAYKSGIFSMPSKKSKKKKKSEEKSDKLDDNEKTKV